MQSFFFHLRFFALLLSFIIIMDAPEIVELLIRVLQFTEKKEEQRKKFKRVENTQKKWNCYSDNAYNNLQHINLLKNLR